MEKARTNKTVKETERDRENYRERGMRQKGTAEYSTMTLLLFTQSHTLIMRSKPAPICGSLRSDVTFPRS